MTQAIKTLARLVRRPLIILVALTLVVSVSAIGYVVVTQRNPFCFAITAHGLLVQMTVAELTRESNTILIGTVAQVGPSWQTTSGWVFTDVTVNASEYLKNPMSQATV